MTSSNNDIERFLDYLINPNECIDTYGRTYIDDLENIVVENHQFDLENQEFPDKEAQSWFQHLREKFGFSSLGDFIAYVRTNEVDLDIANIRPRSTFHTETTYAHDQNFLKLREEDSVEQSNEFQKQWSMNSVKDIPALNTNADAYELYMSSDRVNPWTYVIKKEINHGNLKSQDKVICIGNRWLGEILYFRKNLGLHNTMGVDLFSSAPDLVIAADMHNMPFEDSSVKLIFNRGLLNKSYDVRLLVKEMLRVLKPDGYIIVETPGPYDWGVSRLGRTDVKSINNLLKLFKGKVKRVVYSDHRKPFRWLYDSSQHLRLCIQIDKSGETAKPIVEPFSEVVFKRFDWRRRFYLRAKRKLRRMFGPE